MAKYAQRRAGQASEPGVESSSGSALHKRLNARSAVTQAIATAAQLNRRAAPEQRAPSRSNGLPDPLRASIEAMSGIALDDVTVHRNSDKPAQMQAHAYAQGTDIHLGPGQEKHLPHEAWHVVQQKQGRVRATTQMGGTPLNDDSTLEREADVKGMQALRSREIDSTSLRSTPSQPVTQAKALAGTLLGRGEGATAGTSLVQLEGMSDKLVDEEEFTIEGDGNFVWLVGGENQDRWMSHIHLFSIDDTKITGQMTVRNVASDAGGIAFDSAAISEDDIRSEVLSKFGPGEPGRETRDAVVRDLVSLIDYVISKWERIRETL